MLQTIDILSVRSELRRDVDIDCQLVADVWDVPVDHQVVDLSAHGMLLSCDYPLQVGEDVVVTLTPPSRDVALRAPVYLFGRVCRVDIRRRTREQRKASMAIQFVHESDADADRLAAMLVGIPPKFGESRVISRECVWVDDVN